MEIADNTNEVVSKKEEKSRTDTGFQLKSLIPSLIGILIFTIVFALIARYIEYRYLSF